MLSFLKLPWLEMRKNIQSQKFYIKLKLRRDKIKMKLLYATNNISKVRNMRRSLAELPIEIITPKELGIKIDVVEDGKTAIENAIKKAQAYYDKTKLPTIAGDSGLFIDGVPDDKQPGLFVRRVNGKTLTENEMIEYYSKLIASIGGKSTDIM